MVVGWHDYRANDPFKQSELALRIDRLFHRSPRTARAGARGKHFGGEAKMRRPGQAGPAPFSNYYADRSGTTLPAAFAGGLAQKSAQASMSRRRLSNRSPRR